MPPSSCWNRAWRGSRCETGSRRGARMLTNHGNLSNNPLRRRFDRGEVFRCHVGAAGLPATPQTFRFSSPPRTSRGRGPRGAHRETRSSSNRVPGLRSARPRFSLRAITAVGPASCGPGLPVGIDVEAPAREPFQPWHQAEKIPGVVVSRILEELFDFAHHHGAGAADLTPLVSVEGMTRHGQSATKPAAARAASSSSSGK